MKVRILQDGTYADFEKHGKFNKVSMVQRAAGDVVNYPDFHAKWLVGKGLAVACAEPEAQAGQAIDATSAAFRLADELGVDLETLTGSGKGGRIIAGDVRKAAE